MYLYLIIRARQRPLAVLNTEILQGRAPTSYVIPNEKQYANIKHNTYIYAEIKTAAFQIKKIISPKRTVKMYQTVSAN